MNKHIDAPSALTIEAELAEEIANLLHGVTFWHAGRHCEEVKFA